MLIKRKNKIKKRGDDLFEKLMCKKIFFPILIGHTLIFRHKSPLLNIPIL